MPAPSRYAVLVDGGFIIKKLSTKKHFPTADEIERYVLDLCAGSDLKTWDLLRIYFYHARPAKDELVNPLDKSVLKLAGSPIYAQHESLIDKLELKPNFAVRLGETVTHEWRLGSKAMESLLNKPRAIEARDLVPNISQKGVDLRIGLDIARLALGRHVTAILVVTGDSDLIPAFKFARREGVRVYLHAMKHGVRRDLKVHADIVF